jgi:hypothetical protein
MGEQMYPLPSVRSRPGAKPGWLPILKGALVLLAAVLVLAAAMALMGSEAGARSYEDVTVQPGDTLWGIAAAGHPSSDVRARVDAIMRVNGLKDPVIQPGDHLRVPSD